MARLSCGTDTILEPVKPEKVRTPRTDKVSPFPSVCLSAHLYDNVPVGDRFIWPYATLWFDGPRHTDNMQRVTAAAAAAATVLFVLSNAVYGKDQVIDDRLD